MENKDSCQLTISQHNILLGGVKYLELQRRKSTICIIISGTFVKALNKDFALFAGIGFLKNKVSTHIISSHIILS
jgi:hypothetical protein